MLKEKKKSSYVLKVISWVVMSLTWVFSVVPVEVRGLGMHTDTCLAASCVVCF